MKSQYKGVFKISDKMNTDKTYQAQMRINGYNWVKMCDSEREAALEYDKKLLSIGKDPVNILKRKK